jgi:hypothetical protein
MSLRPVGKGTLDLPLIARNRSRASRFRTLKASSTSWSDVNTRDRPIDITELLIRAAEQTQ